MSGYLFFNRTGVKEIDNIIDVLRTAGNSYHHTSEWDEPCDWANGKSHIDMIQDALDDAAKAFSHSKG